MVDAYLSPIVRDYLRRLVDQFGGANSVQLLVMTSGGGLVDWHDYFGKDSILSGPAGGVSALRHLSSRLRKSAIVNFTPELIGLDMGGTSTDVCRVSSEHNLQYESTKAGIRIFTPTLPIETVASGGGSICWFDGVSLRVGPQSSGRKPWTGLLWTRWSIDDYRSERVSRSRSDQSIPVSSRPWGHCKSDCSTDWKKREARWGLPRQRIWRGLSTHCQ